MAECAVGTDVCCLIANCLKVAKESISSTGTLGHVTVSEVNTAGGILTGTLPKLADAPRRLRLLVKINAELNNATIQGDGAETIEGGTMTLRQQYDHSWLWPGPTCWIKVGGNV